MAGYHSFYGGSTQGLSPDDGGDIVAPLSHYIPAGSISLATDPRTANQIKAVTDKLNTGAKAIEVNLAITRVAEAVPEQHLEEINRIRKLTGVHLTVHGPLVEPTGIGERAWDPMLQKEAERQIWATVKRAAKVNPDGNVVVTVHTSNGLPDPETRYWTDESKMSDEEKRMGGKVQNIQLIDERTGTFGPLPKEAFDYFEKGEKAEKVEPYKSYDKWSEDGW